MKKNKTITALCVSLLALSSSNSLVYAATTGANSASSQTKVATSSQATSSSSTSATSSQSSQAQSSQNASTSSQTVSVSSLSGNIALSNITESKVSDNNYKIANANDFLNWLAGINSGKLDASHDVYLSNDIDMAGKSFTGIREFKGHFYGGNHKISNLNCSNSSSSSLIDSNSGTFENVTFDGLTIKSNDHYLIRSNSGSLTNVSFKNLSLSGTRAYLIDNNSGNINNLNLANVTLNGEAESVIHTNSANLSRVTVDTLKATGYMVDFIETNNGSITDSQFTNMTFTGSQTTFIKVNSSNLQRVGFTNLKLDGTNSEASFIQDNSGALDTVSFDIEIKGRQPRFIGNNDSSLTNIKFNQVNIEGYQASFIQNNGGTVSGSFAGKVEGEDACFINLNNGRYDFDWTDKFIVKDHITNIWELNNFSTYVNNGQVKIDAVLDNNIDAAYENFTPIASKGKPYQGTFDGNGKAIYNFYSNCDGASFIFNNAGTVKHLEISGQVFGEASDFVSHNGKTGLIQDCALILDITGETYDDLFGVTHYGRTANSFENNEGTIKNIFFAGRLTNIRSENDPRNREGTVDHFYYLDQFGVIGGKAIRVSRWRAENGEIAHRLAANSTIGWMQVREYWHYDILSSRPGFSGDKGDQTKPMAEKPSLSINDIDRTEKSLRVTKEFDSKILDEYGGVRYELLDKDGHVLGNGWQESPEFTNLAPKTEYQVAVRFNGNSCYLPSDATIVTVKTKGIAPAVELTKDDIKRTNTSLEVTKKFGSEYGGVRYQLKDTQGNVVKDWQKDNKFTELTPGTEYQLVAQYVGNDDYVASEKVIVNVKTTKEAETPELSSADVKRGDTSLKVTKQFTDTDKYGQVEYELTDGHGNVIKGWQANSEFTGLTPDTEYTISVRYKGNDEYLESDKASVTVKTKKTAEPQVSVDNIYGSSDSFTIKDNPDTSYGNVSYEITDNQGKPIKNGQKQANGDFSGLDLEDGVIYQVHVSYDGNDDYASTEKVIKIMKAPTVTIASKNANSLKVADLANTDKYGQAEYALSPSGLTANATSSTIDGLDSTTSYTVYAKRAGKGDYPPSAIGQVTTKTGNANYVVRIPAVMKTNNQASYVSTDVSSFNLGTHDSLSLSIINSVKDGKVTLTRQNDPARKTAQTQIKLNGRPVNNGNADIKVVDWQNSNCDYTPAISFTDPWNDNPRTPFGDYNGQITFQLTYNKHKEGN
ncbi:hypothetical protein SY111_01790 [Ligilactobacillus agilis]|uniref:Uncharacterized protein n=1 Tax=Ligilactobacillus agilis TaxID=1601 RepID=A0A6F9XQV0_9LACO|nr:hypothetical protein [Ligilactobacillus agilis]GET07555.1 hypothetical protein SY111_01790 [Ligilactobacillus agilis]